MPRNQSGALHICSPADRKMPGQAASEHDSPFFPHVFEYLNLTETFFGLLTSWIGPHVASTLGDHTVAHLYFAYHNAKRRKPSAITPSERSEGIINDSIPVTGRAPPPPKASEGVIFGLSATQLLKGPVEQELFARTSK